MIPFMIGKLAPISPHLTRGWSNVSPVGAIFVPFPPKTGTNMLHPRPPSIVELVFLPSATALEWPWSYPVQSTVEFGGNALKTGRVTGALVQCPKVCQYISQIKIAENESQALSGRNSFQQIVEENHPDNVQFQHLFQILGTPR